MTGALWPSFGMPRRGRPSRLALGLALRVALSRPGAVLPGHRHLPDPVRDPALRGRAIRRTSGSSEIEPWDRRHDGPPGTDAERRRIRRLDALAPVPGV